MIQIPQPERPVDEARDVRVKRLAMRSMRRGIKEMDLIRLAQMDDATLDLYDDMLNENDHDLYQWVTGQFAPKEPYGKMISDIQAHISKG